jgi:hypothetical protein
LETLSFDELRARALAVIDVVEKESPGLGVFVVLVAAKGEGDVCRFAAETNRGHDGGAEILRLVSSVWGKS